MIINSVSSVGFYGAKQDLNVKQKNVSTPNFDGVHLINKKALKGLSAAALLGMATVMGCSQPTTPIYETPIEQPADTQNTEEDDIQDENNTEDISDKTDETPIEDENAVNEEETTLPEETSDEKTDETIADDTEEIIDTENKTEETKETEDISTPEVEEEIPVVNVTRTEQAALFKDENVKAMFDILGLNTKTKKSELVEGGYTPYSGDVLHMEFKISPSTKQVYDLILEESTPDKLVYKNSIVYIKSPDSQYSYKSTFEKTKNGDIIRKDSLDPAHYFKYSIVDDAIKIDTINSYNDRIDYRETIYYQKGENSSEFINNYRGFLKFYTNASVTVEE